MYPNNLGDLLGSSSNRDVHHKCTRMIGIQKYLKESCYHCIECTVATFLAVFMWRRLLNNAILATMTHKKLKRVSEGTNT